MIQYLLRLDKEVKKTDGNFIIIFIRSIFFKLFHKKNILAHQNVLLKGIENIETRGQLKLGVDYVGFCSPKDHTYLNIRGKLNLHSKYSIGRGCRFDIGENAIVSIGKGGYINAFTTLIIMHKLTIGNNCCISWNVQILDEDFHSIQYDNKIQRNKEIKIGNNVWIGSGVQIFQGTIIPDNSVVASNSIVRGIFNDENCIIGGNPAKIIKKNITWK